MHTHPPIQWVPKVLSLTIKPSGCETDRSPLSQYRGQEWWGYTCSINLTPCRLGYRYRRFGEKCCLYPPCGIWQPVMWSKSTFRRNVLSPSLGWFTTNDEAHMQFLCARLPSSMELFIFRNLGYWRPSSVNNWYILLYYASSLTCFGPYYAIIRGVIYINMLRKCFILPLRGRVCLLLVYNYVRMQICSSLYVHIWGISLV
jgi:hypothetical protein